MVTERSDKVFDNWRQATEKFDYFVVGVTGALCAYVSQTYKPAKLAVNPATLELCALVLLVLSVVAGFRRIERTIQVTLLNHRYLRASEEKGALTVKSSSGALVNESTGEIIPPHQVSENIAFLSRMAPEIRDRIEKAGASAHRWYKTRNWLLFLGFSALVFAKVWSAYV